MKLLGPFCERPIVLTLIVFPGGFVAGLLVAPVLYLLTYGDFWKSLGSTLIGFATMGVVFGSVFGFVDLLAGWVPPTSPRRSVGRSRHGITRRSSLPRAAA